VTDESGAAKTQAPGSETTESSEPNPGLRILELRDEIARLPGQRVVDAMRSLDDPVRWILWLNGVGLRNHLSTFPLDAGGRLLFDAFDRDRMQNYLGVTVCLTHNLVAAVGTVIDHTRRTLNANWPEKTNHIQKVFDDARVPFEKDGRLQIIRDLRNFFLHRSIPGLTATMAEGDRERTAVHLSTATLLGWDGWRPEARQILKTAADGIALAPLVDHYLDQAINLHRAVITAIEEEERTMLGEYRRLAEEHDAIVRRLQEAMKSHQPPQTPPLS
jgi:hypothetical protein